MSMTLPKVKMMSSKITTPKLSMPNLKFVSKPNIGYTKPTMSGAVKTRIKLK